VGIGTLARPESGFGYDRKGVLERQSVDNLAIPVFRIDAVAKVDYADAHVA
jgi:hypothetical protein